MARPTDPDRRRVGELTGGVAGDRIHESAARGFEAAADRYERGRPGYPDEAVATLVRELGISEGRDVLDLGAGTGKLTELLVPSGALLVAVEPVAAMRAALVRNCPTVTVLDGTAEAIPVADASLDAVVVAQAFHWFDGERALAEIRRALRPGGRLGLIWNVRDETSEWARRVTAIFDRLSGNGPRYRDLRWREAFERTATFGPLRHVAFSHAHEVTPDAFMDRVLSVSYVASASEDDRARVVDEVTALLRSDPELSGRDVVAVPYRTDVYWCVAR